MSKIICDVCGTSYPETATQCPICGSVRPGDVITVPDGSDSQPASTYTYVKGGRFSKANVRKRNKGKMSYDSEPASDDYSDAEDERSNRGLVIAIIVLLLAIIGVVIYISIRFFSPGGQALPNNTDSQIHDTSESTEQTQDTTEATDAVILCEDIVISKRKIEFEKKGAALLLDVTTMPKDTTEEVVFASSDEKVATVTQGGKVTSVGAGEAVITVTCGSVVAQCEVLCTFESDQEETTAPTVSGNETLELNREDFTMSQKGSTWDLYSGDIPADQITWTSDNESVVTVKDGIVTAVGKGVTKVHAQYGGTTVSCIVRCADSVGEPDAGSEAASDNNTASSAYSISSVDVTIRVGETFALTLKDSSNALVEVTWSVTDPAVCAVSGNSVTGSAVGTVTVSTVLEGVTYACIVRVVGV